MNVPSLHFDTTSVLLVREQSVYILVIDRCLDACAGAASKGKAELVDSLMYTI
jgi:hypothetical protein